MEINSLFTHFCFLDGNYVCVQLQSAPVRQGCTWICGYTHTYTHAQTTRVYATEERGEKSSGLVTSNYFCWVIVWQICSLCFCPVCASISSLSLLAFPAWMDDGLWLPIWMLESLSGSNHIRVCQLNILRNQQVTLIQSWSCCWLKETSLSSHYRWVTEDCCSLQVASHHFIQQPLERYLFFSFVLSIYNSPYPPKAAGSFVQSVR